MSTTLLLEKDEMVRVLERLASQILERHAACQEVMLVGIERRGADLARRLAALLQTRLGHAVPLGTLDINLYRDDWTSLVGKPSIGQSHITESVDEKVIILVDDVLYTGRTIRAALDAIIDMGRPKAIQLAVLVDRGHRELPIRADFVGKNVPTSSHEVVSVQLSTIDQAEKVVIREFRDEK